MSPPRGVVDRPPSIHYDDDDCHNDDEDAELRAGASAEAFAITFAFLVARRGLCTFVHAVASASYIARSSRGTRCVWRIYLHCQTRETEAVCMSNTSTSSRNVTVPK